MLASKIANLNVMASVPVGRSADYHPNKMFARQPSAKGAVLVLGISGVLQISLVFAVGHAKSYYGAITTR
jgi:hypothetical protein